jgi:hypothetical protein
MEIKMRGWGRDMGTKTLVTHDLSEFRISNDPNHTIRSNSPGLFARFGAVTVAWKQKLQHQGSYRMDLKFSQADVFKLFKASYGRELDVDLLESGFKISEALKKRMLSEIKLADLTIGDLAKLGAGASASEPDDASAVVRPLRSI